MSNEIDSLLAFTNFSTRHFETVGTKELCGECDRATRDSWSEYENPQLDMLKLLVYL